MKCLICVLLDERVSGDKLSCEVANLPRVVGIGGDWTGCNRSELWSGDGNDGVVGSEADSAVLARWC